MNLNPFLAPLPGRSSGSRRHLSNRRTEPERAFDLSLCVGKPNPFDCEQAAHDERTDFGGDMMIHRGSSLIGCIAIGDPAIEVVFKAVDACGVSRTTALIAPQRGGSPIFNGQPEWLPGMYVELYRAIGDVSVKR